IIFEKVSPWQRGVIPDKSFKSRVFPCKNTVAVGSAVVEMSVRIDDCCPAGERGSCHLLSLQRVPEGAGCRRRAGMRLRSQQPSRCAAEQRDELAAPQLIELHSDCGISNGQWSVSRPRRASDQAMPLTTDFAERSAMEWRQWIALLRLEA